MDMYDFSMVVMLMLFHTLLCAPVALRGLKTRTWSEFTTLLMGWSTIALILDAVLVIAAFHFVGWGFPSIALIGAVPWWVTIWVTLRRRLQDLNKSDMM
jgi:hypothetical protein